MTFIIALLIHYSVDDSHLAVLVTGLSTVYQWFTVGIHLGLSFSALKTIAENHKQARGEGGKSRAEYRYEYGGKRNCRQ